MKVPHWTVHNVDNMVWQASSVNSSDICINLTYKHFILTNHITAFTFSYIFWNFQNANNFCAISQSPILWEYPHVPAGNFTHVTEYNQHLHHVLFYILDNRHMMFLPVVHSYLTTGQCSSNSCLY